MIACPAHLLLAFSAAISSYRALAVGEELRDDLRLLSTKSSLYEKDFYASSGKKIVPNNNNQKRQ